MTTTTETKIEVKLVRSNFLTRWPCHVCGGHTEKVGDFGRGRRRLAASEARNSTALATSSA